ncbi:hypothetical protein [Cohaesibacter intestini]|uniref:hypothetical protein n=1 Tax=Cohaesibacter intestini TaxID=2211145 RepID=UPI000DEBC87D|nr:hypothetical protein [Cohaesibacter intestini]
MTALFWQELVLIIFAVVIGMMLGGYFRRYFSPAAADQRKATKEKLAAAAASTAVGSATVSKLTDVKDKVLTKMAEAHLEAEAEALAAKTNKDLEGQTVEVDKAVLRDMTVVAIEEDKEPPVETPDDAHFEQYSDADASFLNDEIAAKTEEAREAVVEAASLGASDAELTQLGTDYAAASEAGDANQAPKAEETVEAPSAAEKAEEAREAVVEAASLGASDAELTQLGTDYAAASEAGDANQAPKAEETVEAPSAAEKAEEAREAVVEAASLGASDAELTQLGTDYAAASEAVSDEAGMAAALAALPADASDEDRANAVGSRPTLLKKPKGGKADDLKKIKGIGKVLEGKLNDLGIHHFEQIANWSQAEVNWVTTFLSFKGRIEREEWIPQAKGLLAAAAPTTKAQTPAKAKAKAAPKAKAPAKATAAKTAPVKPNETVDLAAEEAEVAAALAALPKDASAEDKANAAGAKPQMLAAPRDNAADDLKRIKGVGKVLEGKLNDLGIYHFDQIANWSRKEINWVTTFLSFKGRIDREEWIEQAKLLAAGEDTAFSKRVDKGEVDSSKA